MNLLLGLDYGTGGAKISIINDKGEELSYAFEEYPILTPKPGWSEHEPLNYWELACRIIKKALDSASINPADIKGIAVSSALPSLVLVDKDGIPVQNAYNLMDKRATKQVEWLQNEIGEKTIFDISKNRLEDHPAIVNLMWEKENRPETFSKIYKALTIDGFVNLKLTGKYTGHYSGAAFYGVAYNLLERKFDEQLLEKIGLSPGLFPDLYRCEAIIGEVTKEAAAQSGLAPGIPVAAGQVDCNAGWSGAGMVDEGDIQMNLGTCGNFGILTNDTNFPDTMINFSYTTDSEDRYIIVPTTTTGGQLIRYMRDNYYKMELAEEESRGTDTYDLINEEAAVVPAGSEGLVVLPFLMGERTPIWDVDARGTVVGLSLNHTRGHMVRAMMESVAYALYDSFKILKDSGKTINAPIVLNEGGAKSALWRRIITDVFNMPTVMVKRRTGAPFGDAILAGVATGIFKDFSVAKDWVEYVEPLEPDVDTHNLYMEYFALYKSIYENLKGDFKTLTKLRNKY
ncbi:MAG: FGGY-family carbohydrate kinase [Bacteroidales bacterium]|nr:FGGY-family carbohydrate kinase [Bacteroidales bacterium]